MSDMTDALDAVSVREKADVIKREIMAHGVPEHLLGLIGILWSMAIDTAPHNRPREYVEIMEICNWIFDEMDPVNDILYKEKS